MMTQAIPQDYWIAPNALYFELNALGEPDYVQVSCTSGTQIMVYMKGIIGYDAGHNYQRWPINAYPTVFNTHTAKYAYVAIPRDSATIKNREESEEEEGDEEVDTTPSYAEIVFPSELIDLYGKNEAKEQIGREDYYYIFLQGIISSSGDNGSINRDWQQRINTGYLSSDEAIAAGPNESPWYQYSSVDETTTFLKKLTMKMGTVFIDLFAHTIEIVSGGAIRFHGGGSVTGLATVPDGSPSGTSPTSADKIATPAYVDAAALSKTHNDKTDFDIELQNLRANGQADIFGNLVAHGTALVQGDLSVGTVEQPANTHLRGDLTLGIFNKGMQGGHIDFYGNAELESLVLRSFLQVPELRYNRTTITVGNQWQTVGAGIIERTWPLSDIQEEEGPAPIDPSEGEATPSDGVSTPNEATSSDGVSTPTSPTRASNAPIEVPSPYQGVAQLKLEDGEVGAIAVGDLCQGVFHFINKSNDTTTTDDRNGNYHFAGFTTVYFKVLEIYTADTLPPFLKHQLEASGQTIGDNQFFRYELRAATCRNLPPTDRNRWTDASHPQPTMHFACYANATNSARQASRLTTTTYVLHLTGMTDWTYTQDNIQLIYGWLDGFSVLQQVWDKEQKRFVQRTKDFHGEGIATGNIYMWGNIDQFDRAPSLVSQQLYFKATPLTKAPAGIQVNDTHTAYDLNGWSSDTITPTDLKPYIWQQWLYAYSDGTYDASPVSLTNGTKGDKGDPGKPGQDAISLQVSTPVVSIPTADGKVAKSAASRDVYVSAYCGTEPILITELSCAGNRRPFEVLIAFDNTSIAIVPTIGATWTTDVVLNINATILNTDGTTLQRSVSLNVVASAQGKKGDQGDPGFTGCLIRRSEWEEGKEYRNDSDHTSFDPLTGQYIIDEVIVSSYNGGDGYSYLCRTTHTSSPLNKPRENASSTEWEVLGNYAPIKASFADIKQAFVEFLQARQIVITDEHDQPYGAFGGGNEWPLWFGGTNPAESIFKIDRSGKAVMSNAEVTGNIFCRSLEYAQYGSYDIRHIDDGIQDYYWVYVHDESFIVVPSQVSGKECSSLRLPSLPDGHTREIVVFKSFPGLYTDAGSASAPSKTPAKAASAPSELTPGSAIDKDSGLQDGANEIEQPSDDTKNEFDNVITTLPDSGSEPILDVPRLTVFCGDEYDERGRLTENAVIICRSQTDNWQITQSAELEGVGYKFLGYRPRGCYTTYWTIQSYNSSVHHAL